MTFFRKIGLMLFVALVGIAGAELGERLSVTGIQSLVSPAAARVRASANSGECRRGGPSHGAPLRGGRLLLLG